MHDDRARAACVHHIVFIGAQRDLAPVGEQVDAAVGGDLEERDLDGRGLLDAPPNASVHLTRHAAQQRRHRIRLASTCLPVKKSSTVSKAAEHALQQRLEHAVAHAVLGRRRGEEAVHTVPAVQHRQPSAGAR